MLLVVLLLIGDFIGFSRVFFLGGSYRVLRTLGVFLIVFCVFFRNTVGLTIIKGFC